MQTDMRAATQLMGEDLRPGINVIGYLGAINGTAEGGRLLLEALKLTGIPYTTIDYQASPSQVGIDIVVPPDGVPVHDINLLCVNADMTPRFARDAGPGIFVSRYTVGTWYWETEELPPYLFGAFDYVDEVWVSSDYARDAVRRVTSKPVHTVHLPVRVPKTSPAVDRTRLGLPQGYLFMFIFDYFSVARRKNPDGLVEAFKRAFQPSDGAALVIKTINADRRPEEAAALAEAVGGRDDIIVIDRYLPAEEKDSLIGLCDCYISLHRAEGFGLTLAEAMALGRPVIATGYSGNLDFMTEDNSYLVRWRPALVGGDGKIYPATGRWAEPDIDDAARLMRHVKEHPDEAATRGARGRSDITERFSPAAQAEVVKRRYEAIRTGPLQAVVRAGDRWAFAGAMQRAELALARGPDVEMPTGRGGVYAALTKRYRRLLRRVLRNSWVHQQEVGGAMLQGLREVDAKRQREAVAMSSRVETLSASLRDISGSLERIEAELARAPDRSSGAG